MDAYRTPQEIAALRDIAYLIHFGHYPREEKEKEEEKKEGVEKNKETLINPSEDISCIVERGENIVCKTPFDDDDTDDDFSNDLSNPFNDDGNPFNNGKDSTDELNPFNDDLISTIKSQESLTITMNSKTSSSRPFINISIPEFSTSCFSQQVEGQNVSRKVVKTVVGDLYNVAQFDLRNLMEEVAKNKETPMVHLLLEELRTEGLGLQPTTGSCVPPLVFLRAAMGGCSTFTTFTSTSATRATQDVLTMNVKNMYTDTLLLQIWSVPSPSSVVSPSSPPVKDVLTRLIKHTKERSVTHSFRVTKDTTTSGATLNMTEYETDLTPDSATTIVHHSSGVTQREDTVTDFLDSDEPNKSREGYNDSEETTLPGDRSNISIDGNEKEIADGNSSEILPEDRQIISTPKEKLGSLYDPETSPLNERSHKLLEKSKSNVEHFRKLSITNLRSSFRSNFLKSKQNEYVYVSPSKEEENKVYYTASLGSDSYDKEATHVDSTTVTWCKGKDLDEDCNKLNREKSRSTLSITSFSRLNHSLRLSSKKASQVLSKIGGKKGKVSRSETNTPEPSRRHQQLFISEDDCNSLNKNMKHENTSTSQTRYENMQNAEKLSPIEDYLNRTRYSRKSIRNMFKPRSLRTLNSHGEVGAKPSGTTDGSEAVEDAPDKADSSLGESKQPLNPNEIQDYLSSLGKAHLKAELLAYVNIPIKSLVGKWRKEGWLALTAVKKEAEMNHKKSRGGRQSEELSREKEKEKEKARCRFHLRLTLPSPETDLAVTGYDTYYVTLRKLVHAHLNTLSGSLSGYRGEVSPVGDVLLQQLIFFSRMSEKQRSLAQWLVMAEVKPGDPALLLPLLRAIKTHLEAGVYLTAQKRQLGAALVTWVRKVLSDEFEMLHSNFPRTEGLLELARLEDFLRCFNTLESCYELRVLFEREAALQNHAATTDLLQDVLVKHADTWVDALSKEKLQQEASLGTEVELNVGVEVKAWMAWQESLRRASRLSKPILDFLFISFHTYQPIFMSELSVDYLYLVMPRMLQAAAHLLNPLLKLDVDGAAHQVDPKDVASAAHASWVLLSNLTNINKIGVENRLPQHKILPAYSDAFARVVQQWLELSKHLAREEFDRDIEDDKFIMLDHTQRCSQSAQGVADLMKAMMSRMCGLKWPGGVSPAVTTLQAMAQQLMELAAHYTDQVTHVYVSTAPQGTHSIPNEVCVVVGNVEHVCGEVRKHLEKLSHLAGEEQEMAHQLQERTIHLQEHVEDAAEALLRQCLPQLEKQMTKAVQQEGTQSMVIALQEAIQHLQDTLDLADPLLHQLWYRLADQAEHLKGFYAQGNYREDLRQLGAVLESSHAFLTDPEGIGLTLMDEVTNKYKSIQADLKLLGATSAELVSQFYHIRYQDQKKEHSVVDRVIVFNAIFTEDGLRVHVVQAPGCTSASSTSLVKVRLEPFLWFPDNEPLKTHPAKGDPAVFDEVLLFPGIHRDCREGGGILTLQVRSPRLLGSAIVHGEAILPLAEISYVPMDRVFTAPHLRLPLTRPWDFKSYKPLEALMTRSQDKSAVDFLKTLNDRWKAGEGSELISDNSKLLTTFARSGSVRGIKAGVKTPRRGTLIKN